MAYLHMEMTGDHGVPAMRTSRTLPNFWNTSSRSFLEVCWEKKWFGSDDKWTECKVKSGKGGVVLMAEMKSAGVW